MWLKGISYFNHRLIIVEVYFDWHANGGIFLYPLELTKANTVSQYYLEVKLNETWDPALGNSDSAEYKALKSDFEEAVSLCFYLASQLLDIL